MKRCACALLFLLFFSFLLAFPKIALESARSGLLLWYRNLVPVLLPFMILSNLMIRLDLVSVLLKLVHPLFHLIWGTSVYGSYAILAGFLFGYPMGAKVVSDLLKQAAISRRESRYLIGFVNNLSPAFLITFLIHENLERPDLLPATLLILYGAPLLTSLIFAPACRSGGSFASPAKNKASKVPFQPELIDASVFDGILNITKLGVYVMLFSLMSGILRLFPEKQPLLRCLITGLLEITNGIRYTCQASLPFFTRYLCLMLLCSFGGICALMQTLSVFRMDAKTLHHYLTSKIVTVGITLFLTLLLFF